MRSCGFCKFLDGDKCKKGYPIERFEKLEGYKRPKYCTHKTESILKKKKESDAWLNKQLDKLWSQAVRAKGYCELCGRKPPEVVLHAHHIFSRRWFSTRWNLDNGICLCTGDHIYKAHKDIQEFSDFVREKYGDEYIDKLRTEANSLADFTKDEKKEMIENLKKRLTNVKVIL